MRTFKRIAVLTILVGIVGVAFNLLFGEGTVTFLKTETYNNQQIYVYDFWAYIQNIRATISNPSELQLTWQPLQWETITSNILQEEFWQDLGNNMAYILNTIIFALNVILYPIRIAMFVGKTYLSILGINTITGAGGLQWLVDTIKFMISLQIPYVTNT